MELAWRGNGHPDVIGRPITLNGMGMNVQGYFDHGLSVGAMAQEDKLWLGWGIHILNGVGAFHTESFNATWTTDSIDYSWTLEGEADFQAAGIGLDSLLSGGNADLPGSGGGLPPTLGAGVAFDFGLVYQPNEQFTVEAAMEGRGSIRWLQSTSRAKVDPGVFVLQGLDVVNWLGETDSLTTDSLGGMLEAWGEDMVDSLAGTFEVQTGPEVVEAFNTPIQETWRLGFRYSPSVGGIQPDGVPAVSIRPVPGRGVDRVRAPLARQFGHPASSPTGGWPLVLGRGVVLAVWPGENRVLRPKCHRPVVALGCRPLAGPIRHRLRDGVPPGQEEVQAEEPVGNRQGHVALTAPSGGQSQMGQPMACSQPFSVS